MKDIIITSKRKKTEVITLAICFVIANAINLYAIATYKETSYWELLSSLGYVLIVSGVLYLLWSIVRILFYGIKRVLKTSK